MCSSNTKYLYTTIWKPAHSAEFCLQLSTSEYLSCKLPATRNDCLHDHQDVKLSGSHETLAHRSFAQSSWPLRMQGWTEKMKVEVIVSTLSLLDYTQQFRPPKSRWSFPTKLEHKTSPPALALTAVRVGMKAKEKSDHFFVLELQAATFRLQWSVKVKSIGWPRDSCTHVFRKGCEDRVRFHFLETERSLNIHRGGRRESILSMISDGNAIPATSKDILSSPDPAAASTTSESLSLPFPLSSSSAAR